MILRLKTQKTLSSAISKNLRKKIFNLKNRGTLKPGSFAYITIIDPELEWTYRNADSKSKSKNLPFGGWKFSGGVVATIVGEKIVY
jgi:dihydroorotase